MNIFVYSDESGVFDKKNNTYFVYGGVIFLSKEEKDNCSRMFRHAESTIADKYAKGIELKASAISNKDKGGLFRSLNKFIKFSVVVDQRRTLDRIYSEKKSKQRFLDYAYKRGLKEAFTRLSKEGVLDVNEVENIYIYADEHTTATNGRYELRESLLQEFKYGTFNSEYNKYYEPVFPNLKGIELKFCNSSKVSLIRAADIVANRVYYKASHQESLAGISRMYIKRLP